MKSLRLLLATLLFLAAVHFPSHGGAQSPVGALDGMVVSVSDGRHLTVNNNGTEVYVRLHGIDAPVITKVQRNEPWLSKPGQPFAGRAFIALSNKVLHKQVRIEIMKISRGERMVAVVFLGERNINLEMVAEGWAWASRNSSKRPEDSAYILAEEQARSKRMGLWSQENPQPPWEFRKMRKIENRDSW